MKAKLMAWCRALLGLRALGETLTVWHDNEMRTLIENHAETMRVLRGISIYVESCDMQRKYGHNELVGKIETAKQQIAGLKADLNSRAELVKQNKARRITDPDAEQARALQGIKFEEPEA